MIVLWKDKCFASKGYEKVRFYKYGVLISKMEILLERLTTD